MYLCMCTPDLYFTSTEVLIRLQNKSSKIHSTKEQLLFPSTNTCSGGLHGWGDRHLNTLKQFSTLMFKWKCRQQVKSPVGAGNSTKHWSSLALPSCSSHLLWGASLLGFWSTVCLLLLLMQSKGKRGGFNVPLFSSCLQERHFRMQFTCKRWPWLRRQAGESRQLGYLMVTLSSCLISETQEGMLCQQLTAKPAHHKYPQNPPHEGDWGTLGVNQQALTPDVSHQILSLYFKEVSGKRFRNKTRTHNSCRVFVSNNNSNLSFHSHNEGNIAISHQQ